MTSKLLKCLDLGMDQKEDGVLMKERSRLNCHHVDILVEFSTP